MTTACVIAGALILVAGLFAVIVERTNERDEARVEVERLVRENDALSGNREPVIVDVTGDGGMDQLLLEVLMTPGVPEQRRPGGVS